ncbi:MAG: hypothetical protein PHV57_07235 [Methanomicrobiaceae archaeon]|nr:hypothetical protein [Methanomicrobiaceae archaeon]
MDRGMRDKARKAMRRILEAASYDVEEVDDPLDLSAVGRDGTLVVLCSGDPDQIEQFNRATYRLRVGDEEYVCEKLLFSPFGPVQAENCTVWGVDEFVRHAGEAALAEVLGRDLVLRPGEPGVAAPAAPDGPAAVEEALEGPDLLHLPVQISGKRATGIARVQGATKCRFIPYWYYRRRSSGEREVKDRVITFDADETGALNAINGLTAEVEIDEAERCPVPFDSDVLAPKIRKEEAEARLRQELLDRLTQKIRFRYEKGDAIFYEEKVIRPDKGMIRVDLELVYLPVWQVRGGSRTIEVNAYTGDILQMPMDEGVELL